MKNRSVLYFVIALSILIGSILTWSLLIKRSQDRLMIDQKPWTDILLLAHQEARRINQGAVLYAAIVMVPSNRATEYAFSFVAPTGKMIQIFSKEGSSDFDVQFGGDILNPFSSEEISIRQSALADLQIDPYEVIDIADDLQTSMLIDGSPTAPLSLNLILGSEARQDFGVDAVWQLLIVNKDRVGYIAIDAVSGAILKERVSNR